jgi:hypothetical protein
MLASRRENGGLRKDFIAASRFSPRTSKNKKCALDGFPLPKVRLASSPPRGPINLGDPPLAVETVLMKRCFGAVGLKK